LTAIESLDVQIERFENLGGLVKIYGNSEVQIDKPPYFKTSQFELLDFQLEVAESCWTFFVIAHFRYESIPEKYFLKNHCSLKYDFVENILVRKIFYVDIRALMLSKFYTYAIKLNAIY
jgi:hypothetical protein